MVGDKMEIHSGHLKTALMHYFRFERGWVCADEVYSGNFIGDIVVDTGKWTMEVEIKTSKSDLIHGEAKKNINWGKGKNKHAEWKTTRANKFALCVPRDLMEIALEWIEKTNKRYGLYIYLDEGRFQQDHIFTKKTALKLHKNYDPKKYLYKIARRLSGARAFELSSKLQRIK